MDKRSLKSLIIELKDNNKTFQEISDILMNEYNIKMSRQAVCGMYNRTVQSSVEILLATNDIINYAIIGKSNKRIKEILLSRGIKITITDIENAIRDNEDFFNNVFNEHAESVVKWIESGMDTNDIRERLIYKGEEPEVQSVKAIVKKATELMMQNAAISVLAKAFNATDDRALLKDLIKKHDFNITFKDIGKALNS